MRLGAGIGGIGAPLQPASVGPAWRCSIMDADRGGNRRGMPLQQPWRPRWAAEPSGPGMNQPGWAFAGGSAAQVRGRCATTEAHRLWSVSDCLQFTLSSTNPAVLVIESCGWAFLRSESPVLAE